MLLIHLQGRGYEYGHKSYSEQIDLHKVTQLVKGKGRSRQVFWLQGSFHYTTIALLLLQLHFFGLNASPN